MPATRPNAADQPVATGPSPPITSAVPPPGAETQPAEPNAQTAQAMPPGATGPTGSRALPQNPTPDSSGTPPAAKGNATVRLDPPVIMQAAGSTAVINVMLDSTAPVHDFSMELRYDPSAMQLMNVTSGGFLSQDGQVATEVHRADNGVLHAGVVRPPSAPGIPGQGAVLRLVFLLNRPGDYVLAPTTVVPKDVNGVIPAAIAGQAAIKVLATPPR